MEEQWIPILDYAVLKGVSTSTLRRYIKAGKIRHKIENGRYLLAVEGRSPHAIHAHSLEERLVQAQEQISELKMLVAIYEEKLAHPG